jgi:hypothetical protein
MAPTHMTGKLVPKRSGPTGPGATGCPHGFVTPLAALGKGRATAVGHLRRRITHPKIANRGRSIRSSAANRLARS